MIKVDPNMGKGNRSRNNRYDEAYQMTESGAAVKTSAKKDHTTTIIIAVIAAILLGAILLWAFNGSGIVGRGTVVVSSENYEIDANMMKYFQNRAYRNMFEQYYHLYLYYFGSDADSAYTAAQNNMANYTLDSFFESALSTAKQVLVLCEDAKANGIELTDKELAAADAEIDSIDSFSGAFGTGVSEKDARKAAHLFALASKYSEIKNEEIEDSVTDEDIKSYIEENKKDFYSATYLVYELVLKASNYTDDEAGFETAKAKADKIVEALTAAKTEAEFKTILVNYIADRDFMTEFNKNLGEATMPEQGVLDAALEKIKDALIKEFVNDEEVGEITEGETYSAIFSTVHKSLKTTVNTAVSNNSAAYTEVDDDTDEYMKWLLADTTEALQTNTIDGSDDTEYSKTVYMMVNPLHLDESATKEVAHLLVEARKETAKEDEIAEAKKKAEELLAQFKAGEMTHEAFEALAEANTADSGVTYTFAKGEMVEEFENWAFDESRKAGDVDIVQSDYGFHIMYFVGDGDVVYKNTARSAIASEKYTEYIEKESASLTVNQKAVDKYSK